eukprot:9499503-Pyramimonas_sp.AAC.1
MAWHGVTSLDLARLPRTNWPPSGDGLAWLELGLYDWAGMAWHGLAWLGMAWHGLVWLGHGLGLAWLGLGLRLGMAWAWRGVGTVWTSTRWGRPDRP